jgi:hypothetical protein
MSYGDCSVIHDSWFVMRRAVCDKLTARPDRHADRGASEQQPARDGLALCQEIVAGKLRWQRFHANSGKIGAIAMMRLRGGKSIAEG